MFRKKSAAPRTRNPALDPFIASLRETAKDSTAWTSFFKRLELIAVKRSLKALDPSDLKKSAHAAIDFCCLPILAFRTLNQEVRRSIETAMQGSDPRQQIVLTSVQRGMDFEIVIAELLLTAENARLDARAKSDNPFSPPSILQRVGDAIFQIAIYDELRECAFRLPDTLSLMGTSQDFSQEKSSIIRNFEDFNDIAQEFCDLYGVGYEERVSLGRDLGRPTWEALADHLTVIASEPYHTIVGPLVKKYKSDMGRLRNATNSVVNSPISILDNPAMHAFEHEVGGKTPMEIQAQMRMDMMNTARRLRNFG